MKMPKALELGPLTYACTAEVIEAGNEDCKPLIRLSDDEGKFVEVFISKRESEALAKWFWVLSKATK